MLCLQSTQCAQSRAAQCSPNPVLGRKLHMNHSCHLTSSLQLCGIGAQALANPLDSRIPFVTRAPALEMPASMLFSCVELPNQGFQDLFRSLAVRAVVGLESFADQVGVDSCFRAPLQQQPQLCLQSYW